MNAEEKAAMGQLLDRLTRIAVGLEVLGDRAAEANNRSGALTGFFEGRRGLLVYGEDSRYAMRALTAAFPRHTNGGNCSFCQETPEDGAYMVRGPGVQICPKCVVKAGEGLSRLTLDG